MKTTTRQLQVFDAVAAHGSVTAAAQALGMSQSAASGALADLQVILRRPLFAHSPGRPLQITDEGKRLRPIVRSLLSEIDDLERAAQPTELSGTLHIGATLMIAETVLPRLCVEFMECHPLVRISVDAAPLGELIERITRFELETALIEEFPQVEGVELLPWQTDELVLVATPDHPLAGRRGLALADLAGIRWCLREATSAITGRLRYLLHEHVGQLDIAFQSTSNWAVRHAVIAGGGVGCLSQVLVQNDIDNGRLVTLDVPAFTFTRAVSLARPRGLWRSPLVQAFDEFLLAHERAPLEPPIPSRRDQSPGST